MRQDDMDARGTVGPSGPAASDLGRAVRGVGPVDATRHPPPATRQLRMPAEWEPHAATWIAWPHHEPDWPGKLAPIPWVYAEIVRALHVYERVEILCHDAQVADDARAALDAHGGGDADRRRRSPAPGDRAPQLAVPARPAHRRLRADPEPVYRMNRFAVGGGRWAGAAREAAR